MEYKAIDTIYKGYKFRSRLEARWALFFDEMEIKYEYEKEGFDLGTVGWYLPDFWLPEFQIWVEIKPELDERKDYENARLKCRALQYATTYPVMLCKGQPKENWCEIFICDLINFFRWNSRR